jgi:hypothetical protein
VILVGVSVAPVVGSRNVRPGWGDGTKFRVPTEAGQLQRHHARIRSVRVTAFRLSLSHRRTASFWPARCLAGASPRRCAPGSTRVHVPCACPAVGGSRYGRDGLAAAPAGPPTSCSRPGLHCEAPTRSRSWRAFVGSAQGRSHRTIAADLGLPDDTVRRWIRRVSGRADRLRTTGIMAARIFDAMFDPPLPTETGSPLAEAISALGGAVAAARRMFGPIATPWELLAIIAKGHLLAPPAATDSRAREAQSCPHPRDSVTTNDTATMRGRHPTCRLAALRRHRTRRGHPHPACRPTPAHATCEPGSSSRGRPVGQRHVRSAGHVAQAGARRKRCWHRHTGHDRQDQA